MKAERGMVEMAANEALVRSFMYLLGEDVGKGSFGAARVQRVFKIGYEASVAVLEKLEQDGYIEKYELDDKQWVIKSWQ